jgi:hypothetical protein
MKTYRSVLEMCVDQFGKPGTSKRNAKDIIRHLLADELRMKKCRPRRSHFRHVRALQAKGIQATSLLRKS